jgi:hypothetical protein
MELEVQKSNYISGIFKIAGKSLSLGELNWQLKKAKTDSS